MREGTEAGWAGGAGAEAWRQGRGGQGGRLGGRRGGLEAGAGAGGGLGAGLRGADRMDWWTLRGAVCMNDRLDDARCITQGARCSAVPCLASAATQLLCSFHPPPPPPLLLPLQWYEKWWEVSDWRGMKELGAEKWGCNTNGEREKSCIKSEHEELCIGNVGTL